MSPKEPDTRRRKVFDKHLVGLALGETELDDVREKLGDPTRVLEEERVVVLEYDAPKETSITRWKKVQFIFFDDLLMNVTYSEPVGGFTRAALHKVLGQPDETGEGGEGEEGEGPSDIFEVELDEDPMLSFVAHYLEGEKVEALSLCADMADDMLDDDEDPADLEAGDDDDEGDEEDDEASGESTDESK